MVPVRQNVNSIFKYYGTIPKNPGDFLMCWYCGEAFYNCPEFEQHVLKKHVPQKQDTKNCGQTSRVSKDAEEDINVNEDIEKEDEVAEDCGIDYEKNEAFEENMNVNEDVEREDEVAEDCGNTEDEAINEKMSCDDDIDAKEELEFEVSEEDDNDRNPLKNFMHITSFQLSNNEALEAEDVKPDITEKEKFIPGTSRNIDASHSIQFSLDVLDDVKEESLGEEERSISNVSQGKRKECKKRKAGVKKKVAAGTSSNTDASHSIQFSLDVLDDVKEESLGEEERSISNASQGKRKEYKKRKAGVKKKVAAGTSSNTDASHSRQFSLDVLDDVKEESLGEEERSISNASQGKRKECKKREAGVKNKVAAGTSSNIDASNSIQFSLDVLDDIKEESISNEERNISSNIDASNSMQFSFDVLNDMKEESLGKEERSISNTSQGKRKECKKREAGVEKKVAFKLPMKQKISSQLTKQKEKTLKARFCEMEKSKQSYVNENVLPSTSMSTSNIVFSQPAFSSVNPTTCNSYVNSQPTCSKPFLVSYPVVGQNISNQSVQPAVFDRNIRMAELHQSYATNPILRIIESCDLKPFELNSVNVLKWLASLKKTCIPMQYPLSQTLFTLFKTAHKLIFELYSISPGTEEGNAALKMYEELDIVIHNHVNSVLKGK